jgi:arylsulfatase A-like enzyme
MFEGGTRAVSFVHGPRWLDKTAYVNDKLLHITDWMPTLLTLGKEGKFDASAYLMFAFLSGKYSHFTIKFLHFNEL